VKLGSKSPTAPKPSAAAAKAASAKAASASKKPKAVEPEADTLAASTASTKLTKALATIGSIRAERGFKAKEGQPTVGGIASDLPREDLGKVATHGRQGAGFRLDGGSVRGLWVSMRRVSEQGGKKGYELFMFAAGALGKALAQRFETLGAKKKEFVFHRANLAEGTPGADVLSRTKESWSPGAEAQVLEEKGKWRAEFVGAGPRALQAALRLRVYGADAEASAAFQAAEKKLGLTGALAPTTPQSIRREQLLRVLWQEDPQAEKALRRRPFSEVEDAELESAATLVGLDDAEHEAKVAAVDAADLSKPAVRDRVRVAAEILDRDPERFVRWMKDSYNATSVLAPKDGYGDWYFTSALSDVDLDQGSAAYKAAIKKKRPEAELRRVLEFGLIAHADAHVAQSLLERDGSAIDVAALEAALAAAGVPKTSERLAKLEMREVYPGYFTTVDPTASDRYAKAGARYLYSTYDDPERVLSALLGGQKASLTRFLEGILVQGKSSSSDFGTGGAIAVFTRLVTKSAIAQAKKDKKADGDDGAGYGWSSDENQFQNWGGSRPYKLVLNRRVLERTDWWGYNSDEYGSTEKIQRENTGERIIKTIDGAYSGSNELMFPVGNDPAYVDFVVCETEAQKKKLVALLEKQGWSSFNGRPLSEFVRVETHFFEHPDDVKPKADAKKKPAGG
jgi:inorganic pyrophosphatase